MARIFPNEVYMFNTGVEQLTPKGKTHHATYKIEFTEDGILQYIDGAEYPQRGFPHTDAIEACAVAKRLLIILLRTHKLMLPTVKNLEKTLNNYNDISLKVLNDYILLHQTPLADEFRKFIYNFLINLNINPKTARETSIVISCLFEYDNAYRFRLQDLFTSTTKEYLINNPYFGISDLIHISKQRHLNNGVHKKFALIKPLAYIIGIIPKYRKAYINALKQSDFSRLQMTPIDEYWVAQRVDYKFFGEEIPQLRKRLKGHTLPKKMTIKQIQKKYGNK